MTDSRLLQILHAGAGKGLPVVFDFDNTVICGDIGEATLATLIADEMICKSNVGKWLCPDFTLPDGKSVSLDLCDNLTQYYELLLKSAGSTDPTPLSTGYTWCVEIMEGLTVLDVVAATQRAFSATEMQVEKFITVNPGNSRYPIPFFYPEILVLMVELIRKEFEIWVVSASNVWTIRWMVNTLNKILKKMGAPAGIPPEQVIGVSTLMQDEAGRLWKDPVLSRENSGYLNLQPDILKKLKLTSRLHFPVPTYSGKVQCIQDYIGKQPYLAAGDSPGDHAMLLHSRYKLWLARLEKPDYQKQTAKLITGATKNQWVIWPTRCKKTPGILHDLQTLKGEVSPAIAESLQILGQF